MKKLEAIIRHELLEKVRDALDKAGYHGLTISEVRGAGSQRGYTESYRGAKATIVFRPKVKIEIAVESEQVDEVIEIIVESGRTGTVGDGKIFVIPIEDTVRIRTGERGHDAL
jgi:nitrogen regulatory protein P-II 1